MDTKRVTPQLRGLTWAIKRADRDPSGSLYGLDAFRDPAKATGHEDCNYIQVKRVMSSKI